MALTVRAAVPADLAALPAIELSGDAMFAELGIVFPPGPAAVETAIAHDASIVVAGDSPVAFAAVIALDGHPHLEQISVGPTRRITASEACCSTTSSAGTARG